MIDISNEAYRILGVLLEVEKETGKPGTSSDVARGFRSLKAKERQALIADLIDMGLIKATMRYTRVPGRPHMECKLTYEGVCAAEDFLANGIQLSGNDLRDGP
jgi:hypothetical protein